MTTQMADSARRNKGFELTHRTLIDTAVKIVAEEGLEALSMSAVARRSGANRATLYYHFKDRNELVGAIRDWIAEQVSADLLGNEKSIAEKIDDLTRIVLLNPDAIKIWIDDLLSPGDIRDRYPPWDTLVALIRQAIGGDQLDSEIFCVNLLLSAIISPRVLKNHVRPDLDIEVLVRRFGELQISMLKRTGALFTPDRPKAPESDSSTPGPAWLPFSVL
jgi:AcrR family transcriptional regulator